MLREKHQTYNSGLVSIYRVDNVAEPGEMPEEGLTLKRVLRAHERTVGVTRYYAAQQTNVKVDAVVRCARLNDVSTQDVAVYQGTQYRIRMVQYPEDIAPPVMDLSLERVEQEYAIH